MILKKSIKRSKDMETAMEFYAKQMKQQIDLWKEAPIGTLYGKDVLDKMCITHIDASLVSVAYSLAIIADSLKVILESIEEESE